MFRLPAYVHALGSEPGQLLHGKIWIRRRRRRAEMLVGGDIRRDCERHGALIERRSTTVVAHSRPASTCVHGQPCRDRDCASICKDACTRCIHTRAMLDSESWRPLRRSRRERSRCPCPAWAVVWFGNTLLSLLFMQTDFVDMFFNPCRAHSSSTPEKHRRCQSFHHTQHS